MVITRYSLRFLSDAYKRGDYTPPADAQSGESTNEGPQYDRQMFTMESVQLHTIYEKMLFSQTSFPRAGELNDLMNEYVDQLANDFEVIGLTTQDLWGFVEVLDRAAQKTFNSPRITRHLFHALVRLGEYEEACHALHSYMYLVGLTSQAWEESRLNSEALATDTQGRSIPIPNINEDVDEITDQGTTEEGEPPHSIASMRSPEKEAPQDTIRVLLTAVKMYCKELRQGVQAVEIAEIARSIMKKLPKKDAQHTEESWNTLSAQVYRAVGVAYSLLACQTYDPALRPNYHKRASKYLTLSNQLDPNVWETYYQMALQQADMRDIRQAVQSITKALQANPTHVPSWHLLTLACSCPIQNDFQQALKTCEMGLQYRNGLDNKINGTHDECEQQILLQMTHTMLLDAVEGPDAALELQEALFTTYAKISNNDTSTSTTNSVQDSYHQAQNGMVISGSLGNLSEVQLAEQKRRGRSASSSVVGSERTDQLAMPASRSHDNVHGNSTLASRAHSVSSFQGPEAGNKLAVPSEPAVHKHHHLHLFGSRSSSRRMKKDDAASEKESVHKNASTGTLSPNVYENRVYQSLNNSATSLHSTAPSIVNVKGILQPSSIPTRPTTRSRLRQQRSKRILSNLWLLSASSFLNAGKLDEALKAIEEAENVDWTTNPRVWYLLGRFRLQENQPDQAIAAFEKGLVANPMDIECRVWLAKTHMEMGALELAEGILDMLTKGNGWDCAEAWFYLGEVYRRTDRVDQTKDCLFYALDLENTRPIQPFSVLPRCV
ncbi:uncharacterized protein BYT42DRAFT_594592 [Radiomyces spectabilis]|uniref:uncharacterized protein n=1 Tax=Radiomyces spectabilis TaxID=64574 RepID=UPI00221F8165|nr:uncharacterized protein BYT42DRAFT_594592 [Radiomyces spectabilis]KAI8374556.1 hypothetical protein BYT42DRAFT_594592 [Radiomyces spectabilis]